MSSRSQPTYASVPHPRNTLFTVGAAPHLRSRSSITKMNLTFIAALLPATIAGAAGHAFGPRAAKLDGGHGPMGQLIKILVDSMGLDSGVLWFFGILGTVALAVGVGVLVEYGSQVMMRQPYRAVDGHGALMGMLVALLMPPSVPWWVLAIGVAVAIFLGKQVFGGLGGYPMHPAVVGWLVLLLSWPNAVYPVGAASIAAPNATAIGLTAAGGLALWAMGYIRPQIFLGVLIGSAFFAFAFGANLQGGVIEQLLTGHVVLAAFFMATDATCSPANRTAMWAYGLGTGFLIMLIRAFGVWPDAIPFAVMLMNVCTPLLDRIQPKALRLNTTASTGAGAQS